MRFACRDAGQEQCHRRIIHQRVGQRCGLVQGAGTQTPAQAAIQIGNPERHDAEIDSQGRDRPKIG